MSLLGRRNLRLTALSVPHCSIPSTATASRRCALGQHTESKSVLKPKDIHQQRMEHYFPDYTLMVTVVG